MQNGWRKYAAFGHRLVEGWIEPPVFPLIGALAREQERLEVEGSIAEIGVHHGRLFLGLHLARRDHEQSLAIDLFNDQAQNVDGSGRGDDSAFKRNLRRHAGGLSDVTVLSQDSRALDGTQVLERTGSPVRFFSIDGGHMSETVEHDMQTAADSIAKAGIVFADDVFNDAWPGVSEGTFRFLDRDTRLVPFAIGFNKTLFTTPFEADNYRKMVTGIAARRLWNCKQTIMHGEPVAVMWMPKAHERMRLSAKRLLAR